MSKETNSLMSSKKWVKKYQSGTFFITTRFWLAIEISITGFFVLNVTCDWPINLKCPRVHRKTLCTRIRVFLSPQLFLSVFEFTRSHVSNKYQRIHSSTQDSSGEYWQKRMRQGCHIHRKELGSILLRHRIKKISGFGVDTIPES